MDDFWYAKVVLVFLSAIGGGLGYLITSSILKVFKFKPKTNDTISKVGIALFAVLAINLHSEYNKRIANKSSNQRLSASMDKDIAEARIHALNGKSMTDAMRENAAKEANIAMNGANSDLKKLGVASAQFFGFYLINAKTRFDYCNQLGVNTKRFVDELEKVNSRELVASRLILLRNDHIDENQFYLSIKPAMEKALSTLMKDQANQSKMTETEFCKSIDNSAAQYASMMKFSDGMPEQSKMLIDSNPLAMGGTP